MGKLLPENANLPWLCILEFDNFADADAARQLLAEQGLGQALVRKKLRYSKQGAFANWRSTVAMWKAFSNRTFNLEMLSAEMLANGWTGNRTSAKSWLHKAIENNVVERMERGEYRFLPTAHQNTGGEFVPQAGELHVALADNPMCAACQPEPLRCASI